MSIDNTSPAFGHYLKVKAQHPEHILFYRMGDFYEMFFEDAQKSAPILGIVLTKRGKYQDKDIPMCGVPANSYEQHVNKLIKNGMKVAICEQLETAEAAKKRGHNSIIKREVIRIVTPGTILEENLLESNSPNYLMSLVINKNSLAVGWMDISTKKFFFLQASIENLENYLTKIAPKEIIISEKIFENEDVVKIIKDNAISITKRPENIFDKKRAENEIIAFYNINNIEGLGSFADLELIACGSLIEYAKSTQFGQLKGLNYPKQYKQSEYVEIDSSTVKGLEIFKTQSGDYKNSLIQIIDYTLTPIGGRLLKEYIISPLVSVKKINERLDIVEIFVQDKKLCLNLREILKNVNDLERSVSRVTLNRGDPIDLLRILNDLKSSFMICEKLAECNNNDHLKRIYNALLPNFEIIEELNNAILECAGRRTETGFINPDFHPKLKQLKDTAENKDNLLQDLCQEYKNKTGISNLKISKNNLIGYYVEVSKSAKITAQEFIHRQTLLSSIRYTTPELQDLELQIETAREYYRKLELEIFNELCNKITQQEQSLKKVAQAIGKIDIITSFAELANKHNYCRPSVNESLDLSIIGGRHPFVERNNDFIENSLNFSENEKICLLTGPNMAGKSTLLRQNALILILAQIGSFVPAQSASIGVVDKIFSRIGASDNIARGKSTFMVEMIETANIVNNATSKSFVILDELGRGTSTKDGIAIAQSVLEYLHNNIGCKTVFATHYNELCDLEKNLEKLKCYSFEIKKWGKEIIFMYKVIPGKSEGSYGIHVAKLSGIPQEIINRAEKIAEFI